MRVLRVINSLKMGGAERSIETNVPIHIKNGFEMDVLLLDAVKTPFLENLIKAQVKVFSTTKKISIYNPIQILKIIPYLRRYDIVHVHLFPALYWVALAKFISFSKVKLIYTEHSTSNNRRGKLIWLIIDRFIYSFYSTIIAISDATKDNLHNHIGGGKIITINNGVNLDPFKNPDQKFSRGHIHITPNKFILIQIASLREQKDQDTVIRALALLPEEFEFVIVGDGNRKEILAKLAQQLNVSERVHFLGNRTEIAELVNISDIVIMSSHYEGFGRAAIEGMAGGKPLIATDVAGLKDLVVGAGLLFEKGDYKSLAKIIERLRDDEPFYKAVASKCRERASVYTSDKMITGYESIYNCMYYDKDNQNLE